MRHGLSMALVAVVMAAGCTDNRLLGGSIGSPTGISYRQTLEDGDWIAAYLGVDGLRGGLIAGVDWLPMRGPVGDGLAYYVGIGGRVGEDHLGVRLPAGIVREKAEPESEIFGEVALFAKLLSGSGAGSVLALDVAVGWRFFF